MEDDARLNNDDDDEDDDGDFYIIGAVCLSRKMSTLPNCLKSTSTSTSRSVFMVFHGSRLVFGGFSPKCARPNFILA